MVRLCNGRIIGMMSPATTCLWSRANAVVQDTSMDQGEAMNRYLVLDDPLAV